MWKVSARWRLRLYLPESLSLERNEDAVEAIVLRLRNGAAAPDHATVPMPGGWGSVFGDHRHLLGAPYLYAVDPADRAYAVLGFVGWRSTADSSQDNVYGRWFLRDSASWLDDYPTVLDGEDLATGVPVSQRWMWMLAALRILARGPGGAERGSARVLYDAAVERCRKSTIALGGRATQGGGFSLAASSRGDPAWVAADRALQDRAKRARLLARLVLHVLHARLYVSPPAGNGLDRPFYDQLKSWFVGVCDPGAAPCPPECPHAAFGHHAAAAEVWPVMQSLKLMGGHAPLTIDPGAGIALPALFDRYGGEPLPSLAAVLRRVDPQVRPQVQSAYLLGELLAHRLIDLFGARCEGAGRGAFSRQAYAYVSRRMDTTRQEYNARHPTPLAASEERMAVREFCGEMGRDDERTPRWLAELRADLASTRRTCAAVCGACGTCA